MHSRTKITITKPTENACVWNSCVWKYLRCCCMYSFSIERCIMPFKTFFSLDLWRLSLFAIKLKWLKYLITTAIWFATDGDQGHESRLEWKLGGNGGEGARGNGIGWEFERGGWLRKGAASMVFRTKAEQGRREEKNPGQPFLSPTEKSRTMWWKRFEIT